MTAAENKVLLQSIFAELAKGNPRPFVDAMADDFAWTVTGTTAWSKTYQGKKVVVEELLGTLRVRLEPPNRDRRAALYRRRRVRRCGGPRKKSHQGRSALRKQVLFRLPRGRWQAARADRVFGHGLVQRACGGQAGASATAR